MAYGDIERMRQADKRAVVQAARHKLAEIDALLAERQLQRASSPRLIYKTNWDALIRPPQRLRYTDYSRYR